MWQVPAVIGGALVAAKVAAAKAAGAAAAAAAAAKTAGLLKVTIGALTFLVTPIFVLKYKTVEQHARANSDEKVKVKRVRAKDKDGNEYILVVLEAEGKKAVAWLTKKLDKWLEEILPHDGAEATI